MLRRAVLRLGVAVAASLLAGAACLSPTLPLPPPEAPDIMHPSSQDPRTWEIAGDCAVGAMVTLFNTRTHKGVVVEDTDRNGRYLAEIEAQACDVLSISQELVTKSDGTESSASATVVVQQRTPAGVVGSGCP